MKKMQPSEGTRTEPYDLLPEYNFDYRKARPNRFVSEYDESLIMITLDSDVAQVFKTSESVNTVLRALIASMPATAQ